jgi:hypothetical protein
MLSKLIKRHLIPFQSGCAPVNNKDIGILMSILLYGTIAIGCILFAIGFLFIVISPCTLYSYRMQSAYYRLSQLGGGPLDSKTTIAADTDYANLYHTPPEKRSRFDMRFSDIEARLLQT